MARSKKIEENKPRGMNIKANSIDRLPKNYTDKILYPKKVTIPKTLGKPDKNKKVMAMDSCIQRIWKDFNCNNLDFPMFMGYALLSNVAQEPLIRAGVETIADDMTRKFIEIISKGEDESNRVIELTEDLERYKIKSIFNKALANCGYFGGCLVYIDVGPLSDEDKLTPLYLDKELFQKGSFRGLKVIEPINIYPGLYNTTDPTDENYYNPETWFILGKEYHRSRFLYFSENDVPLLLKPAYNFFGIPSAQMALDYARNFTENRKSAQRLLNKFSLLVWATDMSGFFSGGSCNPIEERIKYAARNRDNDGVMVTDKETEEMYQINTPLSGVIDIVQESLDLLCVLFGIPKDKYLGDLPKGLNAGNEGTIRIYYDKIASKQHKQCDDPVEKILKILQLNRYHNIDEKISFSFMPLWEMSDREIADMNNVKANTDTLHLTNGAISAAEIRQRIANDPLSGYNELTAEDDNENGIPDDLEGNENTSKPSIIERILHPNRERQSI